jgi:hypothetical protein
LIEPDFRTNEDRLQKVRERRRPGVDHVLAGHKQGRANPGGQMRLSLGQLVRIELANVLDAVRAGATCHLRQAFSVLVRPRDHHSAGLKHRQVQLVAHIQVLSVTRPDAPELEAVLRRVETSVQDRAVALARRSAQQVGSSLEDADRGAFEGETTGNGTAHHPSSDDDHIEGVARIVPCLCSHRPSRDDVPPARTGRLPHGL